MAVGTPTNFMASMLCCNRFTIINSVPGTIELFESQLKKHGLMSRYHRSNQTLELSPRQIKASPKKEILNRLIKIASVDIEQHNIDTFTLGCTTFTGFAKPLEKALRKCYPDKTITILDPVEFSFHLVRTLVN